MPWWAWLCLGIFGVLVVCSAAYLGVAVIRLGRRSKAFQRTLEPVLAELERSSGDLQERGQRLAERQERFREGQARAQSSYRGLLVLWEALGEVRTGIRLVRFVLARR